jgi:CRP-like cAMP-binding protein
MKAGDYFGEIALLLGSDRTATVIATTELRCYALTPWDFRALVEGNPSIAWKVTTQDSSPSRHEWVSHPTASARTPRTPRSTSPAHMPRSIRAASGRSVTSGRSGHVGVLITAVSPLSRPDVESFRLASAGFNCRFMATQRRIGKNRVVD